MTSLAMTERDASIGGLARSVTGFFLVATAESLLPGLAYMVLDEMGLSYGDQGLLMAGLVSGLVVGNLTGAAMGMYLSVRRSLPVAFWTTAVGCLAVAQADNFGHLLAGQMAVGVGAGLFFPVGLCWTHRLAEGRRLSTIMSLWGSAFPLGLAAAGLLGMATGDWRVAYRVVAVNCLLWGLYQLRPTSTPSYESTRAVPAPPGSWLSARSAVLIGAAAAFGYYGAALFLPTYLVDSGSAPGAVAVLIVVARCSSFPAKFVVGLLADRLGGVVVGLWVVVVMVVSLIALAAMPLFGFLWAIAYLLASGSLFPLFYVLVASRRWRGEQILAAGLARALLLVGGVAAGAVTGLVADLWGRTAGLGIALLPLSTVVLLGLIALRQAAGSRCAS